MAMFRGVTKLVLGVGFAGAFSGYTLHMLTGTQDTKAVQALTLGEGKLMDYLVKSPHEFNPNLPKTSWDFDWDKRDPASLTPPSKSHLDTDGDNEKLSKQVRPTATRHILLIRHGQYNLGGASDEEKTLTPLGWEQAEFTAKRLKQLAIPYNRIIQSSMTRAKNTASVISKHLGGDVPVETCDFLREGAPIRPVPGSPNWRPEAQQFHEDGARIEAAFRRYFHRAEPSQTEDSYEILACHANVIRYFVCRALQFPPEAWLRFSLHNCSITWVAIRPSGRVTVYSIGDIGHMPPHVLTTT